MARPTPHKLWTSLATASLILLLVRIEPTASQTQNLRQQTCSVDQTATIQQNSVAWLGGIVVLSGRGTNGYGCGEPAGSMQAYEALRWVLDLLNKKDEILQGELLTDYYVPGIPLGLKMKNYCRNEATALAATVDLFPELGADADTCTDQPNNLMLGIIGASSSDASMALSDATAEFDIPVISYEATAMQLTQPGMYKNFMRTISPDGPLMEVIVQVLTKLKWHRLVIVYDSGAYGTSAYTELHSRLVAAGICLTSTVVVDDKDLTSAGSTLDRVMSVGLGSNQGANSDITGVIFFGASGYAQELVKEGNSRLPNAGHLQWLFVDFPADAVFSANSVYQHGIISVTAASRFIVEFEDHWIRINETNPSPENPWFHDWFEKRHECSFTPTGNQRDCAKVYPSEAVKRTQYQQDQDVEAAVMSVFTYANALRTAQMDKCGSAPGACAALKAMGREEFYENYLKKVDFTFTANERVPSLASKNVLPYNTAKHLKFTAEGDISDPSYFIYNYNNINGAPGTNSFSFRRVGSYINSVLDLNLDNVAVYDATRQTRLQPIPSSACPLHGCSPCLGLPADVKYYYAPGDLVINGIFSLHQAGTSPLTCGAALSANQYQYLEAMIYAVQKINANPNILSNIKLGGLGLDDCSSATLGQAFLAQVQRGNLVIHDASDNRLDPLTIEAYTAAHTSPLTLPIAEAMNMLRRPLVGYRAVSSELDDASRYPYFIRAVPGINDEIHAIIMMLKKYNWMYVQVIVSPEYYSMDAERVFRDLAAKAGICIVAKHDIGITDPTVDRAVKGVGLHPETQPVVALLDTAGYRRLLKALSNNRGVEIGNSFAFIATTRLGTFKHVTDGYEEIADKIISLSYTHSRLTSFRNYLDTLNPTTHAATNPWFPEWYQTVHGCTLSAASGASTPACDTTKSVVDAADFELIYQVDSVINAVEAIARGLDATLTQYCGAGYTQVCSAFLNAADKGKTFLDHIRETSFNVEDSNPALTFKFDQHSAAIPFDINRYDSATKAFSAIGQVSPWTGALQLTTDLPLAGTMPQCPAPCLECLYTFNHLDYWYVPGDLVIGSIFDVHYKGMGPYDCGDIRTHNGALYSEVFNFALQRINAGQASVKLNNVKLGGLSFDGCSNPPRTSAIINRVHTGMEVRSMVDGSEFNTRDLVSWMTYDSESTVDAATLLSNLGMPIVSPGATTRVLDDKSEYKTFFRTIPSDSVLVRGMAEFIKEMGWSYVVSLNAPDAASRESRDYFRELLAGYGICVTASYEFVTDGSSQVIYDSIKQGDTQIVAVFADPDRHIEDFLKARQAGNRDLIFVANRPWGEMAVRYRAVTERSVVFSLANPTIADFATYLDARTPNAADNPWLRPSYEALFACNFPGTFTYNKACTNSPITSTTNWEQDIWTLSTLNAVYALADAIHQTLEDKCGANYDGVCSNFVFATDIREHVMNHMDAGRFTDIAGEMFKFVQREADRGFRVHRYTNLGRPELEGQLDRAGALTLNGKTLLMREYIGVEANCAGDCSQCSIGDTNLQDFTMIAGDVYLIGLFDVHKKGSGPFTCGSINEKHGLPLLEAFNYAIEYVNARKGIFSNLLTDIQLGGIGLDTCQSPSRAANLVANIHSGNLQLTKGAITVSPNRIEAYIGPMETESTLRVADILSQIAVPQISFGATGVDLLNMERYNYFLRSVPADDKQARAIISYLKKFEYNNILVVSSFDEIGEPGREEFRKLALANKICLKEKLTAGQRDSQGLNPTAIVQQIAQTNSDARVVVLWMKDPIPVLEAASANGFVRENFLFIVTDKWGADPDVLLNPNLQRLLTNHKLVVLDVETADIPAYDEYLETKTPDNYMRNPWFKEFFEDFQNCYWDSPSTLRTRACDKSSTIPRADHYIQDPYVLYVVNAVFSAAIGIDKATRELCVIGGTYVRGACDLYLTSGERRQEVMKGLRKVNFVDDTHQPFFYTEDGQSDRGFHIYNITNQFRDGRVGFMYQNIGSYNDSNFLKLDITYAPTVQARCDAEGTDPILPDCICKFPQDLPSRYMLKQDGGRGLTLVYVGDIHEPHPAHPLRCGPINVGPDLQKLLAFFYAIERINSNTDLQLPDSVKLDGLALDSCTHGLRLGQDVYNVLSGNPMCDSDETGLLVSPASIAAFIVDKDHNALPISSMLNQQGILTISPNAGLTQLQDELAYPYFLSTRGAYSQTAAAILATSRQAGWDYISTIYTDSMMHRSAKDVLLDRSRSSGVCVGDAIALSHDATLEDAQDTLEQLSGQVGARGVVLYVTPQHLKLLLQASQSLGYSGRFAWMIPSDWAHAGDNIRGLEAEVAGSLMFETRSAVLEDFNRYVRELTFTNRQGIPEDWFRNIYENIHQCNILNQQEVGQGRRFPRVCSGDEQIAPGSRLTIQDPAVLHVILSVYAAAQGLTNIQECDVGNLEVAACLQVLGESRNEKIRDAVAGVEFDVLPDLLGDKSFKFSFDQAGNGRAGIVISNYQASSGDSNYVITPLGSYVDGDLNLDLSRYAARNLFTRGTLPTSDCAVGTRCQCKLPGGRSWTYAPSNIMDPSQIVVGGRYTEPETGAIVQVDKIPGSADRFEDTWAIILTVIVCIGAAVSLAVFFYLLVMYPVRGGTSILGFMLSFGIILLYLMALAFIAHADKEICGLRRFALGIVYAFVYSCLLVKLVDCWRVRGKDDSYPAKYSKLGRPAGLFLVTIFLVLVQAMINTEWLILREPDMVRIFYHDQYWPRCTPENFYDEALVLSLCYVMALIVVSLIVALLTFTTTNNHRESRWIMGILILSIPTWVIWCTVSILGSVRVRDAAVAVGLVVNATIMLLLVPVRKLYLLHKYNVLLDEEEEEEEAQRKEAASQRGDYGSVYGHQYDNKAHLHDSGSVHSSMRGDYMNGGGDQF